MSLAAKTGFVRRSSVQHPGENSFITYEVPKGGFIHHILVIMRGALKITGCTAAGTAKGVQNPNNAVEHIEFETIVKSGSPYPDGVLKKLYPDSIAYREMFDVGKLIPDAIVGQFNGTTGGIVGTNGTYNLSCAYMLNFALPGARNPSETALASDQYSMTQLRIYTGGKDTLFSGNNGTWDWSGVTFDIYDLRMQSSPFNDDVAVLYERDVVIPIPGENDAWSLINELNFREPVYDILLTTTTTGGAPTDAVLQELKSIEIDGQPFQRNIYPSALKREQSKYLRDVASCYPTGQYLIPVAAHGMLKGVAGPLAVTLNVKNPGGSNIDALRFNVRCVVLPTMFLPQNGKGSNGPTKPGKRAQA